MDWITGISKAIDYIEEHITEPTDYAQAAKEACSSPFIFSAYSLCCAVIRSATMCVCGGSPSLGRSCSRRSSFGLRFFLS